MLIYTPTPFKYSIAGTHRIKLVLIIIEQSSLSALNLGTLPQTRSEREREDKLACHSICALVYRREKRVADAHGAFQKDIIIILEL